MSDDIWIIGTAMTPIRRHLDRDVLDLAVEASLGALDDAGVTMRDMQVMAVGSQFEPFTFGQDVQKQIGQTGIPLYNVHNACATGATAVRSVLMEIRAGEADMGLALGVEKMTGSSPPYRMTPPKAGKVFEPEGRDGHVLATEGVLGTGQMFGVFAQTGTDYARRHGGVGFEQFAKVAEKNHAHSTLNQLAQYQRPYSLDEIMNAEMLAYPNTLPMSCPTGDGAAAVVLVSDAKLRSLDPDVRRRAVKISAAVMTTDPYDPSGFAHPDVNTLTRNAADRAYEQAGIGPEDLDLVELHDCFATAELVHYDNLRLCAPGGAGEWIDRRAPWRDGELPVNVSGGLISKGHPIGATGVANLYEVATHLRGEAGDRQIEGARVGLTHVIGLGSVCVVHILERAAS
ncbi:MAG: thiolase family protein [Actinobacteria bacterium]|nr:thiolase family protein [Actinomycetota bacterium]